MGSHQHCIQRDSSTENCSKALSVIDDLWCNGEKAMAASTKHCFTFSMAAVAQTQLKDVRPAAALDAGDFSFVAKELYVVSRSLRTAHCPSLVACCELRTVCWNRWRLLISAGAS